MVSAGPDVSCTVTFSEIEATVNIRFSDCVPATSFTFRGTSDSSGAEACKVYSPGVTPANV